MANLRTNNLSGEQGQNAYRGSVYFRGYIDGTAADFLSVPESDDLDMGTGDFTFECWVRAAESSGEYAGIFGMFNYDNAGLLIQLSNTGKLRIVNPTAIDQSGSTVIIPQDGTMGHWHHIAVARSGSTIKAFVNGVEEISHSYSSAIDFANGGAAVIGITDRNDYPGDYDLKGFISNLRLIKGTALYTSAFTPPTSELTIVDGTVLLCCQDSDDPTQEATGKTITANGFTDLTNRTDNLIKNGRFTASATENWTLSGGTAALGTGQSGSFGDGNHVVLTASSSYAYLKQSFTTVIGRTYRTDGQSNGGDASFISTSTSENDAVITDIRGGKTFIATQTTHHVILRGNTGGANFDTISVHEQENSVQPKVIPPYGVDAGNTFGGPIQQSSEGYMYFPTGRTEERGRGRGIFACGYIAPARDNTIDFINIQSMGNATMFGDLTEAKSQSAPAASSTRGTFSGGIIGSTNVIEFITIATTADAIDFGDLSSGTRGSAGGVSNQTRAVINGGDTPAATNVIEFFTIASTGDSTDFGDAANVVNGKTGAASPTRGIFAGGYAPDRRQIEFITIASAGNATDFGECVEDRGMPAGGSNATRALFAGGESPAGHRASIDTLLIATTGNATDFGDLQRTITEANGGASNEIRICFAGGNSPGQSPQNVIDVVNIVTTGAGADFGDLTLARRGTTGLSDSHGGLS